MAFAISTYSVGQQNDISKDQCSTKCENAATVVKNIHWNTDDSINEYNEGELVWGEAAETLGTGECDETKCAECRYSWYENSPTKKEARCKDERVMKFGNVCRERQDKGCCMAGEGQICHNSWPADDPEKWRSKERACRTVPASYINDSANDIDFKFGKKECKKEGAGLCHYGCEGTCHNSWPEDDPLKWKSPMAMCRCKTEDD